MSTADRRATAAKFSASTEQVADQARAARTARTKPVRHTVDLPPARHHRFGILLAEESALLGRKVTSAGVLAALIHLYMTDEVTTRKVRAELDT